MYGDAELRLAPWLREHPDWFFLATKTRERTGDGARRELERSLDRLGVDQVALIQMHNLVEPDEWEVAHGRGGALDALIRARDEGLIRFIGVTGHGLRIPAMHIRSLARFDYDSVLLPFNFSLLQDDGYRADVDRLLAVCAERGVAVQTIKSLARRRWPSDDEGPRFSWYEPLTDPAAVARAVLLVPTLEAAAGGPVPTVEELEADQVIQGVEPLFDGADFEHV